jgi:hypothetical protein
VTGDGSARGAAQVAAPHDSRARQRRKPPPRWPRRRRPRVRRRRQRWGSDRPPPRRPAAGVRRRGRPAASRSRRARADHVTGGVDPGRSCGSSGRRRSARGRRAARRPARAETPVLGARPRRTGPRPSPGRRRGERDVQPAVDAPDRSASGPRTTRTPAPLELVGHEAGQLAVEAGQQPVGRLTSVTATPSAVNALANSTPTAPPPTMTMSFGRSGGCRSGRSRRRRDRRTAPPAGGPDATRSPARSRGRSPGGRSVGKVRWTVRSCPSRAVPCR